MSCGRDLRCKPCRNSGVRLGVEMNSIPMVGIWWDWVRVINNDANTARTQPVHHRSDMTTTADILPMVTADIPPMVTADMLAMDTADILPTPTATPPMTMRRLTTVGVNGEQS